MVQCFGWFVFSTQYSLHGLISMYIKYFRQNTPFFGAPATLCHAAPGFPLITLPPSRAGNVAERKTTPRPFPF